jgi:hypothetical protein
MTPDDWSLHFRHEAPPGLLDFKFPSPFYTPVQQLWTVMVANFMFLSIFPFLKGEKAIQRNKEE